MCGLVGTIRPQNYDPGVSRAAATAQLDIWLDSCGGLSEERAAAVGDGPDPDVLVVRTRVFLMESDGARCCGAVHCRTSSSSFRFLSMPQRNQPRGKALP